jgi:hypothetical protein
MSQQITNLWEAISLNLPGRHSVLDTLFPAHAQPFDPCRDKNVLKLVNYCECGKIEKKERKTDRMKEKKRRT